MFVLILGCGRMGRYIAETLFASGNDVSIVDVKRSALDNLSDSFAGFALNEDATDPDTLRTAGIDRADAVIACTGDDNTNLLVAKMTRDIHGAKNVIVRAVDPLKVDLFEKLGFNVVCPLILGGETTVEMLQN